MKTKFTSSYKLFANVNSTVTKLNNLFLLIAPLCAIAFSFNYVVKGDRSLQIQAEGMEYNASLYYAVGDHCF